jgi:hypothetical protein
MSLAARKDAIPPKKDIGQATEFRQKWTEKTHAFQPFSLDRDQNAIVVCLAVDGKLR